MSPLGQLLDDVTRRNYQVTWSSTLETPALVMPGRHLVVLAANRCESDVVETVRHALKTLPTAS